MSSVNDIIYVKPLNISSVSHVGLLVNHLISLKNDMGRSLSGRLGEIQFTPPKEKASISYAIVRFERLDTLVKVLGLSIPPTRARLHIFIHLRT